MAPVKNITETNLVHWLLDQANKLGPSDWGHQHLVRFLDLRDAGPLADAYRDMVRSVDVQSTATGSVVIRPALVYEGRDLVRGFTLETFKRSIAGPGAQAMAMQLICDPGGSYYKRVRRCEYSECRQFFLPEQTENGPLEKYCTEDCRDLGVKEKQNDRVKASRLGIPVKEFRASRAKVNPKRRPR